MSFFNPVINYLADRRHLRQVILGLVGLLILGGAVLFGSNIEKLLNPPSPGAAFGEMGPPEAELAWNVREPGLTKSRSLGQLAEVNIGAKRYIYALGGAEYDTSTNRFRLLNTVERMEISVTDGSPVGSWESSALWDHMYSGHAAFKAFQFGNYLYVVAGDAHIPDPAALAGGSHPLLFSTIERLDLSNSNAQWQVWAKLTGVNFYPEVLVVGSQLNIVGGVYGLPFFPGSQYGWGSYNLREPIYGDDDVTKWSTYKNVPTIGSVGTGTDGVSLLPGANNEVIRVGHTVTTTIEETEPEITTTLNQVQTQQISPADFAKALSDALLSGQFTTTVSEHYVLNLNATGSGVSVSAGELGVSHNGAVTTDYRGKPLVDTWTVDRVGRLGHLRFLIVGPTISPAIYPVPQGRYGFGLIKHSNGSLLVFGGASWFNPPYPYLGLVSPKRTFWAIEDNLGPLPFYGGTTDLVYQYVGNIAYGYNWSFGNFNVLGWSGTNGDQAGTDSSPHGAAQVLPDTYTLKDDSGGAQGRAFFGLGFMETAPATGSAPAQLVPVIAGGIINSPAWVPPTITSQLDLRMTTRVNRLENSGWFTEPNLNLSGSGEAYNLHVTGLNHQVVVFDGQRSVGNNDEYNYFRVPDYRQSANNAMAMLSSGTWYQMTGFGDTGEDNQVHGTPNLIFAPSVDVRTQAAPGEATTVYVYKAGGSPPDPTNGRPSNSNTVQVLGPFVYGQSGTVDALNSSFTIEPARVAADGVAYAVATVELRDYYNEPIVGMHVTVSSDHEVVVRPLYGDPPDEGFRNDSHGPYLKTGDDGLVRFKLSSTDSGIATVDECHTNIPGACMPPPLDPATVEFVNAGVPWDTTSTVIASPTKVVADGIATSTITVTLRDNQSTPQPVADKKVRVFSLRNGRGDPFNDYGGNVDTIAPISDVTNSNGEATFSVRSSTTGIAAIRAEYQILSTEPGYWVPLGRGAEVTFAGIITSIIPASGRQGENLPSVRINGLQTQWNSFTKVIFSSPADVTFYAPQANGGMGNIDGVALWDNGSATELGVYIPGYGDRLLKLEILAGGGSLRQGNLSGSPITIQTNAEGKATFTYIASTTPGILKLKATITSGTGRPSGTWWSIIRQVDNYYYFLEAEADPVSVTLSPVQPSALRARVYRWNNNAKFYVTDLLTLNFVSDDNGQLVPAADGTGDDANHYAYSEYRPDTTPGVAHVFIWTQFGNSYIAERVAITKIGSAGTGAGITWDENNQIDAPSHTLIVLGGETAGDNKFFRIGPVAKVGIWTVKVITDKDDSGASSRVPALEEETFFTVEPANVSLEAMITISPRSGLRGRTVELAVDGTATTFYNGLTTLVFTPPANGVATGITVGEVIVSGPTRATATIGIAANATVGYWNVEAVTGDEHAPMAGDRDFLVTDQNNYILDIVALPDRLPRDGQSQATLTVFVGRIDPGSGEITKLSGVDVTLDKGTDGGRLKPVDSQGRTIIRTNSNGLGLATATYTVDVGIENAEATITATAEPITGIQLMNYVKIFKEVYPYPGFIVSANPSAIAAEAGEYSRLGFVGVPANTEVTFELKGSPPPRGHLENNPTRYTEIAKYVVDANPIAETVEFWGKAYLSGYGLIRSNIATIEVGLDTAKYRLVSLTANPTHVPAGGSVTSTITARLTFNGGAVNGWPIDFELVNGGFGDYVTLPHVKTVNGDAVTTFVPGPLPSNIIIRARALGLGLTKEVIVSKDVNQTIDLTRSSIWATPTHVPISSDGSKFSVVTVLLKNSNDTPLSGKIVTLTSSRTTQDAIRKGDGSAGNSGTTDNTGRVKFRVSSNTVGPSTITATADGKTLRTSVIFETGNLIAQRLKVIVPFQARDYDNEVLTYIKKDGSLLDSDVFINGYYTKNPRPNNELADLNAITVYLRPNTTYRVWVKGRYHLAKSQTFTGSTDMGANDSPIAITFTELAVGDLLPNTRQVGGATVALPFHDNAVNVVDLPPIYSAWFQNADIPDFLRDFVINTADWLYWFTNYGNGELGGPPPYNQRL